MNYMRQIACAAIIGLTSVTSQAGLFDYFDPQYRTMMEARKVDPKEIKLREMMDDYQMNHHDVFYELMQMTDDGVLTREEQKSIAPRLRRALKKEEEITAYARENIDDKSRIGHLFQKGRGFYDLSHGVIQNVYGIDFYEQPIASLALENDGLEGIVVEKITSPKELALMSGSLGIGLVLFHLNYKRKEKVKV